VDHDIELFLSIAEIAGVFVGFGTLISFSRDRAAEARAALRTVVTIGLVVLVAALLPVGLARYGLTDRALWGWSSGGFLFVIWIAIPALLLDPEYRTWMAENPALAVFVWAFLELPIQVPLVLVVLGVAPTLAAAFYVTALVLNLFEAALVLARLVFARGSQLGS
jgi:hypothetical protein